MTPAQVFAYLAEPAGAGRRRMPLAEGLAWCRRRREHRERWIRRRMKENSYGR